MPEAPSREVLEWAARQVHPAASPIRATPLRGGLTAAMDRLTIATPTERVDVVLRRWSDEPWADGLVARERDALDAVAGHGIPAPVLLGADDDGSTTGVRCTLTTALPGEPDLAPGEGDAWLEQLAAAQARIHAVPHLVPTSWEGWYAETPDRPLDWIVDPGLREAARTAASGPLDPEHVLVHGDYQQYNVLWRGGRLTGVVDWPNAAAGLRGSDVGHCRLNLAILFGPDAAAEYLVAYERAAGVPVDRRADLRALLCFTAEWKDGIPVQVDGRIPLDLTGMPDRVTDTVRAAVEALG